MRLLGCGFILAAVALVAAFAFPVESNAIDNPPGDFLSASVDATAPEILSDSPEHPAVIGVECSRVSVPVYTIQASNGADAGSNNGLANFRAGGRDGSGGIAEA